MRPKRAPIVIALTLATTPMTATGGIDEVDGRQNGDRSKIPQLNVSAPARVDLQGHDPVSPLRIENVRLESASETNTSRATTLKFGMFNESSSRLTDLVLEVSIIEKGYSHSDDTSRPRRVLAGPFTIRGNVVLDAGYTIEYEMLLHNLSCDSGCMANVDVLSVRSLRAP